MPRPNRPLARSRRQAAGIMLAHDYEGQVWIRLNHDIRVRTTFQRDRGRFEDLPWIGDVAPLVGWDHWTIDDLTTDATPDVVDEDELDLHDEFDIEAEQDEPSIYFNPVDDEEEVVTP